MCSNLTWPQIMFLNPFNLCGIWSKNMFSPSSVKDPVIISRTEVKLTEGAVDC